MATTKIRQSKIAKIAIARDGDLRRLSGFGELSVARLDIAGRLRLVIGYPRRLLPSKPAGSFGIDFDSLVFETWP